MKKPISVQLYTVRQACAQDFPGTLRKIADIGYKGVEPAGLHGMEPKAAAALIEDLGMVVSSSHVAMPTAENVRQLVDTEAAFGNTMLVSGMGPADFKTLDLCKKSAARFQEAAVLAKEQGVKLACHNHWWEFLLVDGLTPYDILMAEAPDLLCEVDVYWTAYAKADPVKTVSKYRSRVPLLHIKDGSLEPNQPHLAVGSGKLDMPAIVAAADPEVLQWVIVELDDCATDMMEAVRESYRYLVGAGLAAGNKE